MFLLDTIRSINFKVSLFACLSALALLGLSPFASAQMLESQRIRSGSSNNAQMNSGLSNSGQAYAGQPNNAQQPTSGQVFQGHSTGEPTAVRTASHMSVGSPNSMNQTGGPTQPYNNTQNGSYESQSNLINGMPLAPRTESSANASTGSSEIKLKEPSKGIEGRIAKPTSPWTTLFSLGFSLGIVVCLFLGVAWFAKKSMPAGSARLPAEVVEVLGRSTIAPRQQVYVLRFGRKLLLVSQQPGQTQTLSEITDEEEVIRLAGICEANSPRSATRTFSDVLKSVAMGKSETPARAQRRTA